MALGTVTVGRNAGQSPSRPLMVYHLDVVGDGTTPAGGTLAFTTTVRAALSKDVTIVDVMGYGFVTATGALSLQTVRYIPGTDALQILGLADGAEDTGDQSANTYRLTVVCQ